MVFFAISSIFIIIVTVQSHAKTVSPLFRISPHGGFCKQDSEAFTTLCLYMVLKYLKVCRLRKGIYHYEILSRPHGGTDHL